MKINDVFESLMADNGSGEIFPVLLNNIREGISTYISHAGKILDGSSITLKQYKTAYFSIERHFFSTLFLYSYYRAGIPEERRVFYAALNQCLRGMVTGCDNILDDEYKKTIDTNLPEAAFRFRSIADIMISDRILFKLLSDECTRGRITTKQVSAASAASFNALAKSGVQEASEESGVSCFLDPEQILSQVHHYKTGVLFQSPWAIPAIIEDMSITEISEVSESLYSIGMGCQILDDMVDLSMDLRMKRHNYVASLIFHTSGSRGKSELERIASAERNHGSDEKDLLFKFPDAQNNAIEKAIEYLNRGMGTLFKDEHSFMKELSIEFISRQIGADRFLGTRNIGLRRPSRRTSFKKLGKQIRCRSLVRCAHQRSASGTGAIKMIDKRN